MSAAPDRGQTSRAEIGQFETVTGWAEYEVISGDPDSTTQEELMPVQLAVVEIVAADMPRSLAFYRALGSAYHRRPTRRTT